MADLDDVASAQSVKIIGSDATGVETSPITSIDNGNGGAALEVAQSATNFIFSSANSSSAQLAVGATFTGVVETVVNQQALSILLTCDQPGTLTVRQYSDAAGLKKVPDIVYQTTALGFSRCITLNGSYINILFKNTGTATTTTLRLDVAFGTLPAVSALGNGPVALDEVNGVTIFARPDGVLRIAMDPTSLLQDTFETLNTVDTWTVSGTNPPTGGSGALTVSAGTAALAQSLIRSQATISNSTAGFLQYVSAWVVDAAAVTGNKRFFGFGVQAGTPTVALPITNGVGFEFSDTDGSLWAVAYSNSVRTQAVAVGRPSDGNPHRYAIYFRASRVYFEVDSVTVGSIAYPNPQIDQLQVIAVSVNGASALGAAATLVCAVCGAGDSGRNNMQISDGVYGWRKARVSKFGGVQVEFSEPSTYSAAAVGFVTASAATDVFTISGSATRLVRIHKIKVSATTTSGSAIKVNFQALKRSTANTGGTSVATAIVSHDSADGAATAVVRNYTANPTALGTLVGAVRADSSAVSATGVTGGTIEWVWNETVYKPIVLRSATDFLCVNLGGATITGAIVSIAIEWSEIIA